MDTEVFLFQLAEWVELMNDQEYADAHSKALDVAAVGDQLAGQLDLARERFGLEAWRGKSAKELMDGLTGVLVDLAGAKHAEDSERRRGGKQSS